MGRRALAIGLSCAMLAGTAMAEGTMKEGLGNALEVRAKALVCGGNTGNMYDGAVWTSRDAKFPASYDLREQGYVPSVRNQRNWSTCWGFAAIAGSEISILSKLGLTAEEYLEKYGHEMNLSEKHLAWFTYSTIPEGEDQAGEGIVQLDDDEGHTTHYKSGGMMGYASTQFSAGQGPVWESIAPYKAADGTDDTNGDWTLPEELRYMMTYELENSAMLPSPSGTDADGNYVYNRMGTEAIKQELLAGRAVTIAYHADKAQSLEAMIQLAKDSLLPLGYPEERIDRMYELKAMYENSDDPSAKENDPEYVGLRQEITVMLAYGFTYEQYLEMAEAEKNAENDPEAAAAAQAVAEEKAKEAAEAEAARRAAAAEFGVDYDEMMAEMTEADAVSKLKYINTETYAQYTDNRNAMLDHGVCIIGWDDNYDVTNFPSDHQPPANGAWIVRNSWGPDYGNNGYFYLSYYDQTISMPESFDYVVYDDDEQVSSVDIQAYDLMPVDKVNSVELDAPTYMANVFATQEEEVLSAVSVMTASMNAKVTVAVYLLNENATSPVDGTVLDTVTETYEFGGYHRISLHQNYVIPANRRISIVQLQRTETTDGTKYAVPYTSGLSRKGMEALNTFMPGPGSSYCNGVIGENESYIRLDGEWEDWANVIGDLQEANPYIGFASYDNLNMKAYFYDPDELNELHHFGEAVQYCGVNARICEDCGYTVVVA